MQSSHFPSKHALSIIKMSSDRQMHYFSRQIGHSDVTIEDVIKYSRHGNGSNINFMLHNESYRYNIINKGV